MNYQVTATLLKRSLQPAQPADINALLRLSITDHIERLIERHPDCSARASAEVDGLLQTLEGMGGGHDI